VRGYCKENIMHKPFKLITAASLLALAHGASADCSAITVKGVWGFSYDAVDLQTQRSCVGIGYMSFTSERFSNDTVKITAQRNSCNGDPATTFAASGSYSVAAGCTGKATVKYTSKDPGSKLDFNIVAAGTRLQFILVQSNGLTLHGEAVKR
jgi:hypothetical protein